MLVNAINFLPAEFLKTPDYAEGVTVNQNLVELVLMNGNYQASRSMVSMSGVSGEA